MKAEPAISACYLHILPPPQHPHSNRVCVVLTTSIETHVETAIVFHNKTDNRGMKLRMEDKYRREAIGVQVCVL